MSASPARAQLRWQRELLLFLGAYALYGAGRWLALAELSTARHNAQLLIDLERSLGLFVERAVQQGVGPVAQAWLDHVYLASEFVVLPIVLVLLFRFAPPSYLRLRTALLAAWILALPIFALFPVAPPRLADIGLADTVSSGVLPLQSRVVTPFYNPYAAMPSLHCGFALALGLGVIHARRGRVASALAMTWPAQVALATVATGNHYLIDVAAGFAVASVAWFAAPALADGRSSGSRPTPPRRTAPTHRASPLTRPEELTR